MTIISSICLLIFSLFWGGLPTYAFVGMIIRDGFNPISLFCLIFTIIGSFLCIKAIRGIILAIRLMIIAKKGKDSTGTFLSFTKESSDKNYHTFKIIFTFENENGKTVEVKTQANYSLEEANYFAYIKKFKIKYSKNLAVIVETINYATLQQMRFNQSKNNTNPLESNHQNITKPNKPSYYICDYCGNVVYKPGKCGHCGANIKRKKS